MRYLIVIISFLFSLTVTAQSPDFKFSFNINDGLSDNRVYSIIQDDRGFIWLGTHNGLSRFDGKNFTVFNTNNSDLKGNTIWDIKKGPPQYIIMGTRYGAVVLNTWTSEMRTITITSVPELDVYANNVRHLGYTDKNEIILGTLNGVYVVDWNGNLITMVEAGFDVMDLGIKRLHFTTGITTFTNGDALLLTTAGYYYYDSYLKKIIKVTDLPDSFKLLKDFLKVRDDSYVFESNQSDQLFFIDHWSFIDSLYILDIKKQKVIVQKLPFVVKNNIRWDSKIQFHSDSLLTITTARDGFFIFRYNSNNHNLQLISERVGSNLFCQYVLLDVDRNYWLGTESGIFYGNDRNSSIENISIEPFIKKKGYHPVTAILLHQNKTWIGGFSENSGVIVLDKNRRFIKRIDLFKNPTDRNFIISISAWSQDTLLVGTKYGAFFLDCNTYAASPFNIRYSNNFYSKIIIEKSFQSADGEIWLSGGQTGGVWKINKKRDSLIHIKPGKSAADFPMRNAGAFAEDTMGNIWMVHWEDGITRYNRQKKAFDTLINKWPGNILNRFDCSGIVIDKTNNFWFFINSFGLVNFDLKKNTISRKLTTNDQADDNASSLLLTDDSLIWMNLRHSIVVYNTKSGNLSAFSSKNGLPQESNSLQKLVYEPETKTILAGFSNNISLIPNKAIGVLGQKKKVFITSIKVLKTNEVIDFTRPISLSYKKNDLRIDFAIPDYDYNLPHSDFEYRLNDDETWISTGPASYLNLNNLKHGDYHLQIRQAGFVNDNQPYMAEIQFSIKPAFHQTLLFYLFIALAVFLILYGFYRYRVGQIKKVNAIREKIATDLHDDIGSRLTNIRVLSEMGENDITPIHEKKIFLQRIIDEALASGEALDEIVHHMQHVEEESGDFSARMRRYASELYNTNHTELILKIDDEVNTDLLGVEQKRDLFLSFKEILNNINKHAHARHVFIELKSDAKNLFLLVKDDGKGFTKNETADRNGLKNIQSRISKWEGKVRIDSQSGSGTSISIRMPFEKTSHIRRIFTWKYFS